MIAAISFLLRLNLNQKGRVLVFMQSFGSLGLSPRPARVHGRCRQLYDFYFGVSLCFVFLLLRRLLIVIIFGLGLPRCAEDRFACWKRGWPIGLSMPGSNDEHQGEATGSTCIHACIVYACLHASCMHVPLHIHTRITRSKLSQ